MKNQQILYRGISCAAWGYLFEYLDINFNGITVMPAFIGYWLFLKAIHLLKEEHRDLVLLRPLGLLLLGWNLLEWLCTFAGYHLKNGPDFLQILALIVSLANLYFHFQFITDLAEIAARHQGEGNSLDVRLLHVRSYQTIFLTVAILMMHLPVEGDLWQGLTLCVAAVGLITGFCVMMTLFSLRKLLDPMESSGD